MTWYYDADSGTVDVYYADGQGNTFSVATGLSDTGFSPPAPNAAVSAAHDWVIEQFKSGNTQTAGTAHAELTDGRWQRGQP